MGSHDNASGFELSVIIPTHNSARWLPSTIGALRRALSHAGRAVEVIVVDDGSTDETSDVLQKLAVSPQFPLRIITQSNRGRFLARWEGASSATSDRLLLLDSRVVVAETALTHVFEVESAEGTSFQWNGHVPTDPTVPLVGRFWDVPTHLFWAEYLADPRVLNITTANFDRVPKGTTFAMLDRQLFIDACRAAWPQGHAALTSDDTKILRHIVARKPLRLDPEFTATYRPRITVRSFLLHTYDRGTLFVDSYAGTSALRNVLLAILLAAPIVLLVTAALAIVLGSWALLIALAVGVIAAVAATSVLARARRAPVRACLAFIVYVLPFGVAFWGGLFRGAIVHRSAFARRRHEETTRT